jgi:hypothetical protein
MHPLRAFFLDHRRLAALLVALTLVMKALVPAGFMVDGGARTLSVHICGDAAGSGGPTQITIPQRDSGDDGHKGHADSPCHFTALGHAVTGGADPIQLILVLALIISVSFAALAPTRAPRILHLRPPLRGPPARA